MLLCVSDQNDIIFSAKKNYYVVTKRHSQTAISDYFLYKFSDENMTFFEEPMVQTLRDAVNLCIDNDVITFITSDDQNKTYLYMQRPNVMLQIDMQMKGWKIVDPEMYKSCLNPSRCIYVALCEFDSCGKTSKSLFLRTI